MRKRRHKECVVADAAICCDAFAHPPWRGETLCLHIGFTFSLLVPKPRDERVSTELCFPAELSTGQETEDFPKRRLFLLRPFPQGLWLKQSSCNRAVDSEPVPRPLQACTSSPENQKAGAEQRFPPRPSEEPVKMQSLIQVWVEVCDDAFLTNSQVRRLLWFEDHL